MDPLQSYPNGASNRASDCISPSFFCRSVSPFPSIPVATSTNPRGTLWDLGFTDLRRATSKWNMLLRGTVYAVVEARVGSGRFVTSLFLSPPYPILNSEFAVMKSLEEFSLIVSGLVPNGAYIFRVEKVKLFADRSFFNLKHDYRSARR